MNAFEKWYNVMSGALLTDGNPKMARAAYIAGLLRAAEIADEFNDPEYVSNIVNAIEDAATRLKSVPEVTVFEKHNTVVERK